MKEFKLKNKLGEIIFTGKAENFKEFIQINDNKLSYANIKKSDLSNLDLFKTANYYTSFTDVDLLGFKSTYTNFINCFFISTDIRISNLENTSFVHSVFHDVDFSNSIFEKNLFNHSRLETVDFKSCDFSYIDFSYARLNYVDFTGSKMKDLNFENAYLENVIFKDTRLKKKDYCFKNCKLINCEF